MTTIVDLLNPVLWGVAGLGALAALLIRARATRGARLATSALLALAALALLATMAVARWLPPRALLVNVDGSTGDPRVITVLALGAATAVALATTLRAMRLPALGLVGFLVPGLGLAGLVVGFSSIVGLGSTAALAALALAGFVLVTGLAAFARLRWTGLGLLALQCAAIGLLLGAGALSLHGARATAVEFHEGAVVDTLGLQVALADVQAPSDSVRRMAFGVSDHGRTARVWTALEGRTDTENRSIAGAGLLDGPMLVPLGLQEIRPEPHGLEWVSKGDSVLVGASSIRLVGFRILPGDTVRMLADLDVTTEGRTQRVSPGMYARAEGTTPFAATAEGLGPIALVKIDADNGRVALMLPTPSTARVTHVVTASVHLRPALRFAWLGGGLVALLFLLGLAPREESGTARA